MLDCRSASRLMIFLLASGVQRVEGEASSNLSQQFGNYGCVMSASFPNSSRLNGGSQQVLSTSSYSSKATLDMLPGSTLCS